MSTPPSALNSVLNCFSRSLAVTYTRDRGALLLALEHVLQNMLYFEYHLRIPVIWVSCLPHFSIYRKEFSCDYSTWEFGVVGGLITTVDSLKLS